MDQHSQAAPTTAKRKADPHPLVNVVPIQPSSVERFSPYPVKQRRKRVPKNCSSCLKSKTKCDRERPYCGRCVERGLTCEYACEADTPSMAGLLADNKRLNEDLDRLKRLMDDEHVLEESMPSLAMKNIIVKDAKDPEPLAEGSPEKPQEYKEPSRDDNVGINRMTLIGHTGSKLWSSSLMSVNPGYHCATIYGNVDMTSDFCFGSQVQKEVAKKIPAYPIHSPEFHPVSSVLLNYFFQHIYYFWPLHHEPWVRDKFQLIIDGKAELSNVSLVLSVFSVAAYCLNEETRLYIQTLLPANSVITVDNIADAIHQAAHQSLDAACMINRPSVETLGSLVMLQVSASIRSPLGCVTTPVFGTIVDLAYSLGMHRDPSNFTTDPVEAEFRRRIWYEIVALDRQRASHLFRPTFVSQNSYDTLSPGNVEGDNIILAGVVVYRALAIEAFVRRLVFSSKPVSYNYILSVDKHLQSVLENRSCGRFRVPEDFATVKDAKEQPVRPFPQDEITAVIIECILLRSIMILHKPFMRAYRCPHHTEHYHKSYRYSFIRCWEAARRISQIVLALHERPHLTSKYTFLTSGVCLYHGIDATCLIGLSYLHSKSETDPNSNGDMIILQRMKELIRKLVPTSVVAREANALFDRMFAVIHKKFANKKPASSVAGGVGSRSAYRGPTTHQHPLPDQQQATGAGEASNNAPPPLGPHDTSSTSSVSSTSPDTIASQMLRPPLMFAPDNNNPVPTDGSEEFDMQFWEGYFPSLYFPNPPSGSNLQAGNAQEATQNDSDLFGEIPSELFFPVESWIDGQQNGKSVIF
ncbi:Oleate-activated transcription factor 1 [Yarrowia sp. C11]|nr:Oleate-activated transcription factor 1 [Yarrowia sp. C11]KAG5364524.1 Oleate-activated transcription factor 1 [Yarrowia sp. E02]